MNGLWFVDADQTTQSGEKVNDSSRFFLDATARDPVFPIKDAGNAVTAFEQRPFLVSQFTVSLLQVTAVIGSVDDDRVTKLAEFFELCDKASDGPIRIVNRATVDCFSLVDPAILRNDFLGRRDRVVRFIEPEIDEEGFIAVAVSIEPSKSFVDHDLAGITFHLSHTPAIAQEVGRVLVTASRAVDDAEPVVEAMIVRGRIIAILDGHAEVPFAKVCGGVTVCFEHFGDRRFALQEVHQVKTLVKDRVDSGAMVVTPCQKGGARGGAGRSSRVKVGEAHSTSCQLVEDGCLDRTTITADVPVTEVVDVERDNVGTAFSRGGSRQDFQRWR